jgi:hypothetical protein
LQVLKELDEKTREANENSVPYWLPLPVQVYDIGISYTSVNNIYMSFAEFQDFCN